MDVAQPTGDAVDEVLPLPGAEDAAGDGHLSEIERQYAVGVVEGQRDLRHPRPATARAAREDHVPGAGRPQGLHALRAQGPQDRVGEIALPAAVRPHDAGDTRAEFEGGAFGESLEARELQALEIQGEPLSSIVLPRVLCLCYHCCRDATAPIGLACQTVMMRTRATRPTGAVRRIIPHAPPMWNGSPAVYHSHTRFRDRRALFGLCARDAG